MKKSIVYLMSFLICFITVIGNTQLEQKKKAEARMDIKYFNTAVSGRYLSIKVTARIDKKRQAIAGAEVTIYLDEMVETARLGNVITNSDGIGTFPLPQKFFASLDTVSEFTFFGEISDHPELEDKESDLVIKEIDMKAEFTDNDSIKWITAFALTKNTDGSYSPIDNIKMQFFVERPFNNLPISKPMRTDEKGTVTTPFPLDLPGDSSGYLTVIMLIDDSDDYGTVERRETVRWGVPSEYSDDSVKRSLWAAGANAPIILLLLTNFLIAATWGIIFYIIYKIYCLSRL